MEKVVKTYIQKSYNDEIYRGFINEEVTSRSPLLVENDGRMDGFRYYDEILYMDNDKIVGFDVVNVSNWLFFGKREKHGQYCDWCRLQNGNLVPMLPPDLTYNEYVEYEGFKMKLKQD